MAKTLSEALFGDSEGIEERQSRTLAKELRKPELAPSENTLQPGPLGFGDIFSTAIRGGTAQLGADINRFQAVGQMLTGFDEAAQKNLEIAESYDAISSDLLNQIQPFEDFLEEPTLGGFFTQVTKALGQFTPMMVSSLSSGLAGAGVGMLAKFGARTLTKKPLDLLLKEAIKKKDKGLKLTPEEAVLIHEGLGYAKWAKRGGIAGAFGQEYVVGSSQSASEFQEAGMELTRAEAAQAALLGIPQAVLGTASETIFANAFLKASLKKSPLVALDRKAQTFGVQNLTKNEKKAYVIFQKKINKKELTEKEQAFLDLYSGPKKNIFSSAIREIGKGFIGSGAVEGITEVGQEGLGIAQRMSIDPNYTNEEAKLRLAEAAFAGFFAGGARGAVGGAVSPIMSKVSDAMARGKADQIDFQAQIINEAGNTDALEKTIEIVQAEVGSPKQVMFLPQSRVETYQDMYPEVNFGDRTVAVPYKGGVVVGTPEAMKKANNLFQANIAADDANVISKEEKTRRNVAFRDAVIEALDGEELSDVVDNATHTIKVFNADGRVIATKEVNQFQIQEERSKLQAKYPEANVRVFTTADLDINNMNFENEPSLDEIDVTEAFDDNEGDSASLSGLSPFEVYKVAQEESQRTGEPIEEILERLSEQQSGGLFGAQLEDARLTAQPEVLLRAETELQQLKKLEKEGGLTLSQKRRLDKLKKGGDKKTKGGVVRTDARKYKKTTYQPKVNEETGEFSTEDQELIDLRQRYFDSLTEQERTELGITDINSPRMQTYSRSLLREYFRQRDSRAGTDPEIGPDLTIIQDPDDANAYVFGTFEPQTVEARVLDLVETAVIEGFKFLSTTGGGEVSQASSYFKIRVTNAEAGATIGYGDKEVNFAGNDVAINLYTLLTQAVKIFPQIKQDFTMSIEELLQSVGGNRTRAYNIALATMVPEIFAEFKKYGFEVVMKEDLYTPMTNETKLVSTEGQNLADVPMFYRRIDPTKPAQLLSPIELQQFSLTGSIEAREVSSLEFQKYLDILKDVKQELGGIGFATTAGIFVDKSDINALANSLARKRYIEEGGSESLFTIPTRGIKSLTSRLDELADLEAEIAPVSKLYANLETQIKNRGISEKERGSLIKRQKSIGRQLTKLEYQYNNLQYELNTEFGDFKKVDLEKPLGEDQDMREAVGDDQDFQGPLGAQPPQETIGFPPVRHAVPQYRNGKKIFVTESKDLVLEGTEAQKEKRYPLIPSEMSLRGDARFESATLSPPPIDSSLERDPVSLQRQAQAAEEQQKMRLRLEKEEQPRKDRKRQAALLKKVQDGKTLTEAEQSSLDKLNEKTPLKRIISGGQLGGDQFFLYMAKAMGLETGGTAPKGFKVEGGVSLSLGPQFNVVEGESSEYPPRTRKNVEDSDGTIILTKEDGSLGSGSRLTVKFAEELGKPFLIVNPGTSAATITNFIRDNNIEVLNGAGSRASSYTMAKPRSIPMEKTPISEVAATVEQTDLGNKMLMDIFPQLAQGIILAQPPVKVKGQEGAAYKGTPVFNTKFETDPDAIDMELGEIKVSQGIANLFDIKDPKFTKDVGDTSGERFISKLSEKMKGFGVTTKVFVLGLDDEVNFPTDMKTTTGAPLNMVVRNMQNSNRASGQPASVLSVMHNDGPLKGLPKYAFVVLNPDSAFIENQLQDQDPLVQNAAKSTFMNYALAHELGHVLFKFESARLGLSRFLSEERGGRYGSEEFIEDLGITEADFKKGEALYRAYADESFALFTREVRGEPGYNYQDRAFPFEEWYADKASAFLLEQEGTVKETLPREIATERTPVNIYAGANQNTDLSNLKARPFRFKVTGVVEGGEKYDRKTFSKFQKSTNENSGVQFQSVEHAYQTLKSGKFDEKIYNNPRWGTGNVKIKGFLKENRATNLKLMKDLIKASLEQNADHRKALLDTGNRKITHTQDNTIWKEQLPKTLMQLRSEFVGIENRNKKTVRSYFTALARKVRVLFNTLSEFQIGRLDTNPVFNDYAFGVIEAVKRGLNRENIGISVTESKDIDNWVQGSADIVQKAVGKKNATRFEALIKKILKSEAANDIYKFLVYILAPADNFLRLVSPELGKALYSRSQTVEDTGFFNYHPVVQYRYINDFYKIFNITKDPTQEDLANIDSILEGAEQLAALPLEERPNAANKLVVIDKDGNEVQVDGGKALDVLKYFEKFYDDYILPNEINPKKPKVQKNITFFTRQFDIAKLAAEPEAREALVKVLKKYNPKSTTEELRNAVDKMVLYDESLDAIEAEGAADLSIGMQKDRRPLFINISNNADLRNIEGIGDLIIPAHHAVRKYISENVKKIEFKKKVRVKITKKDIANNSNQLDKKQDGVIYFGPRAAEILINRIDNDRDRGRARKAVQAMLGRAGMNMPGWLRTVQSYLLALNVMTYLTFATVASLPDLAGPALRSKEMSIFSSTFINSVKDTWANRKELEQFAREVGVIGFDSISQMYINAGELGYMTEGTKYYTQQFFKFTGLEWYTRFTRIFAAGMGRQFLIKHANDNSAKSKAYLAELQVTPEQIKAAQDSDWDFSDPQHREVQDAIARFTEESVVRPNAAERPGWASNPYTALIFQLKSFFYAYGKNIIGGVIRNVQSTYGREGRIPAAALPAVLALTSLLPLAMVGMELRELLKFLLSPLSGTVDFNSNTEAGVFDFSKFRTNEMGYGEYLLEAADRSGAFGAWTMLFPMFEAGRFGDEFYTSLLGPSAQRLEDLIKGDAQFKDYQPFAGAF
jgi:predicted NAD-dependent protein-ADP-ribosyltransferase YbiA (DUF1768 family)